MPDIVTIDTGAQCFLLCGGDISHLQLNLGEQEMGFRILWVRPDGIAQLDNRVPDVPGLEGRPSVGECIGGGDGRP